MYIHDRRVTYSEISMRGYADIAQIAEYFQDCSVFQSEVLGIGLEYLTGTSSGMAFSFMAD